MEARDLAEYLGISETPLEDGEVRVGKSLPDLCDRVRVSSVKWGVRYAWEIVMELCK